MTTQLHNLIKEHDKKAFATNTGTQMHDTLRRIVISPDSEHGDREIISNIKKCSGLAEYFSQDAQTEAPIAGSIDGKFISRRIDRLIINHKAKNIKVLDYKTDINPSEYKTKYTNQLREYCKLLSAIYPDFSISAAILWTHEWRLEQLGNPCKNS